MSYRQDNTVEKQCQAATIDEVRERVGQNFPDLWGPLKVAMSTVACGLLEDLPHCIGVNFVGDPASGKTTVLDLLGKPDFVYRSDNFTPKSFVSQYAGKSKESLQEVDLLPRICHKTILIPELAPTLGTRYEDLLANISILTRIFDGRGYLRDGGTHGQRGYEGDYRFCWLAATTPLEHKVWRVLGKLGSRWVFYHVESGRPNELELAAMLGAKDYRQKIEQCQAVVQPFLEGLWQRHGGFGNVPWDRKQDDPKLLTLLAAAAKTAAEWRALKQSQDEDGYNPDLVEDPKRITHTLYCLARGHALVHDRQQLADEDVEFAAQIAYSSVPEDRRRIFNHLLNEGGLTNKQIAGLLGCSEPTAIEVKKELLSLGLVGEHKQGQTSYISLPIVWKTYQVLP